MKSYDPKMKKHVQKKRLYNVGPLATVDNLNKIETGADIFSFLRKDYNDKWFYFLKDYLQRCNFLPFPFEEQLNILLFFSNPNIRVQLIKKLKSFQDFNPNTDPIPFDKLPQNLSNYLYSKKEYLTKVKEDIKENLFVEKNIIGIYTELECTEDLSFFYDYLKIDIIIFAKDNDLKIKFNKFDPKFYEIKGKEINKNGIFEILYDYCGKPEKNNDFYILKNTIQKGELIEIIKNNIV